MGHLNKSLDERAIKLKCLSESDTRWSARADACKAFSASYKDIKKALMKIAERPKDTPSVRLEAKALAEKMELTETNHVRCLV